MKSQFLLFFRSAAISGVLAAAVFAQVSDTDVFTNLFEEESKTSKQDLKKRSSTSVLDSGNKVGVKIGFTYVLQSDPLLVYSAFFAAPFSQRLQAELQLSKNDRSITAYTLDSVVYTGSGKKEYLVISGLVKLFIKSTWLGAGVSFNKFLRGELTHGTGNPYQKIIISDSDNELNALVSVGYMAEIRENVFLLPEFNVGAIVAPSFNSKIQFGLNLGLAFRL